MTLSPSSQVCKMAARASLFLHGRQVLPSLFFCFTLVTGPRRSLGLKLSDTRVYEP